MEPNLNKNMGKEEKITNFLDKIEAIKKESELDLSSDEDLSIAVMNLVSIEEHFFFSGAKTGKNEYYDLLSQVREMRKELLAKLLKDPKAEEWCISKHLLAASMRLIEVGTKYQSLGKKEEARGLFKKAYNLYSIFWGMNLKIIDIGEVKKIEDNQINIRDKNPENDLTNRLNDLVQKLVDCCKE